MHNLGQGGGHLYYKTGTTTEQTGDQRKQGAKNHSREEEGRGGWFKEKCLIHAVRGVLFTQKGLLLGFLFV